MEKPKFPKILEKTPVRKFHSILYEWKPNYWRSSSKRRKTFIKTKKGRTAEINAGFFKSLDIRKEQKNLRGKKEKTVNGIGRVKKISLVN